MLRLAKYLKPYTAMIILSIVMLFIQANCELALPDYMSKIVNNGIQSGGIENAVPKIIRQSQMDRLVVFFADADKTRVLNDYTLVDPASDAFRKVLQEYPGLSSGPVYVLKPVDAAEIEWLNPLMAKALLSVTSIQELIKSPEKMAFMAQQGGFDLSKIPQGTDIFALMGKLPAAQRAQMNAAMDKKLAAMGSSMVIQSGIQIVKTEYGELGLNTSTIQMDYLFKTGLIMLLLTLASGICTITVSLLSARTAAGLARDVRSAVFQKVEHFSSAEFDHFSTASLITRTTNDITQIQTVVIMLMRMVLFAPIMGVGGIIRAISKNSSMWWVIAVAVVMLIGMVVIVFSLSLPRFKLIQKLIDRLNLVTRENLAGMMVVRAFNRQNFELNRFDRVNQDLTETSLFVNRIMAVMFPGMGLIMNGLSLLIIGIGAQQVAASQMQVGDMMAFLQYAMQIVFSFLMMSMAFIFLPRASVSADRVAEVLDMDPTIRDPQNPQTFPKLFKGKIEFKNVSFRYPGAEEDVLHNINFTAQPGQTTAFIGSTGSGKSTVVNLIPRFYDVTEGAILVDGVDIREVTQHDLRERIGYVPQKSVLFSGTIQSNLKYARENADADLLQEAVEISQASEFIQAKSEGLEAEISQGGMNVSGGQKQRLSIARALVKRAPIYIFDDSFSALDFKTDAALRKALKEKTVNGHLAASTLMLVTQRVSTIRNADQIIVLDNGRIAGKGTHQELMNSCETYREIALSQLSMEELS